MAENDLIFNKWICLECKGKLEFTCAEMMRHFIEVHQIDPETAKGTRRTTMISDAINWFQWDYEINIDDKKFLNSVRIKRDEPLFLGKR